MIINNNNNNKYKDNRHIFINIVNFEETETT